MGNEEVNIIFTIIISSIIIFLLIILFFAVFSKYKEKILKSELEIKNIKSKFEREILYAQLEIQEETFRKISREIHDNISLGLTLAKLQLNNAVISDSKDNDALVATVDLISKSLVDLNDISKSLDAKQMVAHGLINALQSEVKVIKKSGLIDAELEISGEPIYFDAETDLILLRVFQECCNNIIKHAEANKIDVDLIYNPGELLMKISDNGIGFDVEAVRNKKEIRKMSGLKNLETRAKLIHATFEIISFPSVGTTINIKIPFKKNQDEK